MFILSQVDGLLNPVKYFLNTASGIQRFSIAQMACGALVNGGSARVIGVAGNMKCDAQRHHMNCTKPLVC